MFFFIYLYIFFQIGSLCVRVPAARRGTEVRTDLPFRGKSQQCLLSESAAKSSSRAICPVSVAAN